MNVSFTGLHNLETPGNKKFLQKIITDKQIEKSAQKAFDEIDKKSGDTDVFLITYHVEKGGTLVNKPTSIYRMSIVDKDYNVLSEAGIMDEEDIKRNYSDAADYSLYAKAAFGELSHDMPDLANGEKSNGSLDFKA